MTTALRKATGLGLAAIAAGAMTVTPAIATAGGSAMVTNGNDAGPGSLRHALETSGASTVWIARDVDTISIQSTLVYDGTEALRIRGTGQVVRIDRNATLLAVTNGADLSVSDLAFEGTGGYSITARGDLGEDAGKGIFVDVRDDQTGTVKLRLRDVSVSGVANHGIHVSDCSLADACGSGSGGGGDGSPASIRVHLDRVRVDDVGNGRFDADGVRVDDRGAGGIRMLARDSSFTNVGADGVELDEGDAGEVEVDIVASTFSDNGGYCDPGLLGPFLPPVVEAEFAESEQVTLADIPAEVTGSPDDRCFEREVDRYASGFVEAYEFGIDLDDGIDLDEAGPGALVAAMTRSTIEGNLDEGVDFDEEGDGYAWVRFVDSRAAGNTDDGFKLSEEDAGAVIATLVGVESVANGGAGVVLEEADTGDLAATAVRTTTAGNDGGDGPGIEAVQEDAGEGVLRIRASDFADGVEVDGVEQR